MRVRNMEVTLIFELIGTVAFAISGANLAIEKKMDILGVAILGLTTAVGGGVIRDVLLGITPPIAFKEPYYALTALLVSIIVFIPKIRKFVQNKDNLILLTMDTIGLAVFTVIGTKTGMQSGNRFLAIFVGVATGVAGGVLRDLFAGEKPYIFVRHFYACASIIGATLTVIIWGYNQTIALIAGGLTVAVLRFLAARYKWSLPKA